MKIGIIINPNSRKNKKNNCASIDIYKKIGEDIVDIKATKSFEELDSVIKSYKKQEIPYIGISGGDGTIHHVLSHIINTYSSDIEKMPKILLLGDGTMNNIANSVEIKGKSSNVLRKFIKNIKNNTKMKIEIRDTLKIDDQYCLLFGLGFVSNFLNEVYSSGKKGLKSNLKAIYRSVLEALSSKKSKNLFKPINADILIDDKKLEIKEVINILAGTVEKIGMGFSPLSKANHSPNTFHILASGMPPINLITNIGKIKSGKEIKHKDHCDRVISKLEIKPNEVFEYTMDGDMYKAKDNLLVTPGPRIKFVIP